MAEVKITLTADDKASKAISAAMAELDKQRKAAESLQQQRQAAIAESQAKQKQAIEGAIMGAAKLAAGIGGVVLAMTKAYEGAEAFARRLGRTDVVYAFRDMQLDITLAGDAVIKASGALDVLKASMEAFGNVVKIAATIAVAGIYGFQMALADAQNGLAGFLADFFQWQAAMSLPFSPLKQVYQDAADSYHQIVEMAKASGKDIQAELQKQMAATLDPLVNPEARQNLINQQQGTYNALLQQARDYQRRLRDINFQSEWDIQDAMRQGDALALIQAQRSKQRALAQLEADRVNQTQNLAVSSVSQYLPTGTEFQKLANQLGVGGQFAQMLAQYTANRGTLEAGGKVEPAYLTMARDIGTAMGQNVNQQWTVVVKIGDKTLDEVVTDVVASKVFNAPGGKSTGGVGGASAKMPTVPATSPGTKPVIINPSPTYPRGGR